MASKEIEVLDPAATVDKLNKIAAGSALNRRHFISALGMTGAAAGAGLMSGCTTTSSVAVTTVVGSGQIDILNFALNLEYLQATFYSYITTGVDIPASAGVTAGSGAITGTSTLSAPLVFTGTYASQITDLLNEVYFDELNHVIGLRNILGSAAISRPAINLAAFGAITATNALSIARILEDIGVTAYTSGITGLTSSNATYAAQILGAESFHSGALRLISIQSVANPPTVTYMAAADGQDVPPADLGTATLAAAGPTASGGFYPTYGGAAVPGTTGTASTGSFIGTPGTCGSNGYLLRPDLPAGSRASLRHRHSACIFQRLGRLLPQRSERQPQIRLSHGRTHSNLNSTRTSHFIMTQSLRTTRKSTDKEANEMASSNDIEVLDPTATVEKLKNIVSKVALNRRHFMAALGAAGIAAGTRLGSGPVARAQQPTPNGFAQIDVINFLLNIKYLKATFYSYVTTGADLPGSSYVTLASGQVYNAPGKISFSGTNAAQITDMFNEMYYDELNQLIDLRNLLGVASVPRTTMNLLGNSVANATYVTPSGTVISTGAQAIGQARMLEDISVTAFAGALSYLTGPNLAIATQILAVDGCHAAALRLASIQTGAAYQGTLYQSSFQIGTNGTNIVTAILASTAAVVGDIITAPGLIPAGAVITAITPAANKTPTGVVINTSKVITGVNSIAGLAVGQPITGDRHSGQHVHRGSGTLRHNDQHLECRHRHPNSSHTHRLPHRRQHFHHGCVEHLRIDRRAAHHVLDNRSRWTSPWSHPGRHNHHGGQRHHNYHVSGRRCHGLSHNHRHRHQRQHHPHAGVKHHRAGDRAGHQRSRHPLRNDHHGHRHQYHDVRRPLPPPAHSQPPPHSTASSTPLCPLL